MVRMVKVERPLFLIDQFIQDKKKKVTKKRVYTEVSHKRFQKHEMAHLVSHPTIKDAKEYSVVFKDTFYNRNKKHNVSKLKKIAAHELAHIKVPHKHNEEFQKTARGLGAGKYAKPYQR